MVAPEGERAWWNVDDVTLGLQRLWVRRPRPGNPAGGDRPAACVARVAQGSWCLLCGTSDFLKGSPVVQSLDCQGPLWPVEQTACKASAADLGKGCIGSSTCCFDIRWPAPSYFAIFFSKAFFILISWFLLYIYIYIQYMSRFQLSSLKRNFCAGLKHIGTKDKHVPVYCINLDIISCVFLLNILEYLKAAECHTSVMATRRQDECASIYPFINYALILWGSWGGCSQSQLTLGERRGASWEGLQSITGLTNYHSHSYSHLEQLRVCNEYKLHVVGLWEEAGVPRENPHWHRENRANTTELHQDQCSVVSHFL